MEHFFIPTGDTKKQINEIHDGDCAMDGKGTFVCNSCLKASAEILLDPLAAGIEAVKWAVKVDVTENGKASEFFRPLNKIPDSRMPSGFRIDLRTPEMIEKAEEYDPALSADYQKKMKEAVLKAENENRRNPKGAK